MHNLSPTSRFLFIRHGQTIWNHDHRYAGSSEVPLSEEADQQIHQLSEYLKSTHIDVIYSSPLERCITTIKEAAAFHKKRIIIREELRERNLGEWEGKYPKDIHPNHPGYHYPDSAYNGDFRIPGAETLDHLELRVRTFLAELRSAHPGQTVAIATHAGLIWMLQARIVANRPHDILWPGNCSVSTVVTENQHYLWAGIDELPELLHQSNLATHTS